MTNSHRIAMWSGPRNISTAMMRAWGSRADTAVIDEPFYAHYLLHRDVDHPGREEVIAAQENDWRAVAATLTGPIPDGKTIFYQKHMTHHMLRHMDLDWMTSLKHAFLIREPRRMLSSLAQVLPNPTVEQTGLPQQVKLFEAVTAFSGSPPPVIDAADVLKNPRGALTALCAALDVPFDPAMLSWPAGPRETDGVWAKYWYASVEASTGFKPYREDDRPEPGHMPGHLRGLLLECEGLYARMAQRRLPLP